MEYQQKHLKVFSEAIAEWKRWARDMPRLSLDNPSGVNIPVNRADMSAIRDLEKNGDLKLKGGSFADSYQLTAQGAEQAMIIYRDLATVR